MKNLPKIPLPSECPTFHYILAGLDHIKVPADTRIEIRDKLLQALPLGNAAILQVLTDLERCPGIESCEVAAFGAGLATEVTLKGGSAAFNVVYDHANSAFATTVHDLLRFVRKG